MGAARARIDPVALPFPTREAAGEQLARLLQPLAGQAPLVLGLPGGGMRVARVVAQRLDAPLDVVLVRHLPSERDHDRHLGAMDEAGWIEFAPGVPADERERRYLAHQIGLQRSQLAEQAPRFRDGRARQAAAGRYVIVIDDGIASGASMAAALHGVRRRGPARLACAVPVASREGIAAVAPWADECFVLATPLKFEGIERYYLERSPLPRTETARASRVAGV